MCSAGTAGRAAEHGWRAVARNSGSQCGRHGREHMKRSLERRAWRGADDGTPATRASAGGMWGQLKQGRRRPSGEGREGHEGPRDSYADRGARRTGTKGGVTGLTSIDRVFAQGPFSRCLIFSPGPAPSCADQLFTLGRVYFKHILDRPTLALTGCFGCDRPPEVLTEVFSWGSLPGCIFCVFSPLFFFSLVGPAFITEVLTLSCEPVQFPLELFSWESLQGPWDPDQPRNEIAPKNMLTRCIASRPNCLQSSACSSMRDKKQLKLFRKTQKPSWSKTSPPQKRRARWTPNMRTPGKTPPAPSESNARLVQLAAGEAVRAVHSSQEYVRQAFCAACGLNVSAPTRRIAYLGQERLSKHRACKHAFSVMK